MWVLCLRLLDSHVCWRTDCFKGLHLLTNTMRGIIIPSWQSYCEDQIKLLSHSALFFLILFKVCVLGGPILSLPCCPSWLVSWWLTLLWSLSGNNAAAATGSDLSIAGHLLLRELPAPAVQVSWTCCIFFFSQHPHRTWPLLHFSYREALWQGSPIELSTVMGLSCLWYIYSV